MPCGDRRLVVAVGPDEPALLGDDDRGAGVLAHRQHAAGGDIGVLQEVVGDELVVVGRLRVVEDLGELGEMAGAQQMVDVDHRLLRRAPERLALDDQELARRAPSRRARPRRSACDRASRPGRAERGRWQFMRAHGDSAPRFARKFQAARGSGRRLASAAMRRRWRACAGPCRRAGARPSGRRAGSRPCRRFPAGRTRR